VISVELELKQRMNLAAKVFIALMTVVVSDNPQDWSHRLYSPTFVEKLGDNYFIVDCWHNRVLYSHLLSSDLADWKTLDADLAGPHSIASDGKLLVVEDTGRHGLRVYQKLQDGFRLVQQVADLGGRTHRVRYDRGAKAFYVLSSDSQEIIKLVRDGKQLVVCYRKPLEFLQGKYTRSMTIYDGVMFFVSGPGEITKTRYEDDSYTVLATYRVPKGMEGMNDLFRTDDGWWYLTATPTSFVRARSLEDLEAGRYEDLYQKLGLRGTPYYLSHIEGRFFLPQVDTHSEIISFLHHDDRIADVQVLCDFGAPNAADQQCCKKLPK